MAGNTELPIKSAYSREPETPAHRLIRPFLLFSKTSASGGAVLIAMTVIAMVWANSPFKNSYEQLFHGTGMSVGVAEYEGKHKGTDEDPGVELPAAGEPTADPNSVPETQPDSEGVGRAGQSEGAARLVAAPTGDADAEKDGGYHWRLKLSLGHWINDGLMALFFLLVGLEIKREVLVGELSDWKKASLPVFGAVGGMVVPGAIYAAINWGTPQIGGWGTAVATDIAFALGVLALAGKGVPSSLRVFLLSLAIADDLGALLVIAIFYTDQIAYWALGASGGVLVLLAIVNRLHVKSLWVYLLLGLPLWYFVYRSGVHATIAGVLLAMTIPARGVVRTRPFLESNREALDYFDDQCGSHESVRTNPKLTATVHLIGANCKDVEPPLQRLEHALVPWASFLIIPIFALANAGVTLGSNVGEMAMSKVTLGVVAGLVIGKPLGVMLFAWLAVKLKISALPQGVTWISLQGVGWLAGIGFTMSLFIANLAFAGSAESLDSAKLGILGASTIASIVGLLMIKWCIARKATNTG